MGLTIGFTSISRITRASRTGIKLLGSTWNILEVLVLGFPPGAPQSLGTGTQTAAAGELGLLLLGKEMGFSEGSFLFLFQVFAKAREQPGCDHAPNEAWSKAQRNG